MASNDNPSSFVPLSAYSINTSQSSNSCFQILANIGSASGHYALIGFSVRCCVWTRICVGAQLFPHISQNRDEPGMINGPLNAVPCKFTRSVLCCLSPDLQTGTGLCVFWIYLRMKNQEEVPSKHCHGSWAAQVWLSLVAAVSSVNLRTPLR